MSRYGRSDLRAVNPADGCADGHVRAAGHDGVFEGPWELTCPLCEVALVTDQHWAGDPSDVPLTPEEQKALERLAEQGKNNSAQMAAFFSQMMQAFQVQQQTAQVQVVPCANCGVPGAQGARFCAGCGTPVTIGGQAEPKGAPAITPAAPEPAAESEGHPGAVPPAAGTEPAPEVVGTEPAADLKGLHVNKLKKLARDRDLDDAGTRADLIARLEAAAGE